MSAEQNIAAASAAIMAGARTAPTVTGGDLVSGMISILRTVPPYSSADGSDGLAAQILVDVVQMVGERRARELIGVVAKAGAGKRFG